MLGCSSVDGIGYYGQTILGHVRVMRAARPVDEVIADPDSTPKLRAQLQTAQSIRSYASAQLHLPDNDSYRRYADLHRAAVVWNVFAAPALSLELHRSCFLVVGCVGYRGYYAEDDAKRYAAGLAAQGYDTQVAPVPAYSTLGWFADPLLNTFIGYPPAELARLIFHELAHQRVFVKGDTTFNESFATAVEEEGVERWLREPGHDGLRQAWRDAAMRRDDFRALLADCRSRLEEVYRSGDADETKRARKAQILEALRADYHRLRDGRWGGYAGYDRWFDGPLGNAHLASVGSYTDWVPAFRHLLAREHGDLIAFYARVAELGGLAPGERSARLRTLADEGTTGSPAAAAPSSVDEVRQRPSRGPA